jgi:phage shock protein PspC (stress-responsive transcriptional regulator)
MNKVVTINLNGNAYQLEEGGYDALRLYLDGAARRLEGNPDQGEILADIEQAIADKCVAVLGANKTVVGTREIEQIIDEMGPVEDAASETDERESSAAGTATGQTEPGAAASESRAQPPPPPVRRLYKIRDGAMISGVCNGIAAYFGIDPTIVRLVFVLMVFLWGTGILAYIVLALIVPTAGTTAEKAAACGAPFTAQEFIHRAREGYYEGMKTWGDKHAHRKWRREFKREMRGWGRMVQHEMRENACRWQQHWVPRPGPGPGLWITLPILSLLRGLLALLTMFALISLVTTGAVFGLPMPAGVPVWVGVIVLILAYQVVAWPLKALRHAWYYHAAYGPRFAPPLFWLGDTIVWLGFVILLVWLADRYLPHAHEALRNLPPVIHHAVDNVKQWWAAR